MKKRKQIGFYRSILSLRCPSCRQSYLFKKKGLFCYYKPLDMHEHCTHCGQKFEIEPGFWIGALWASYPIVVLIETPFLFTAITAESMNVWYTYGLMIVAFGIFFPLMVRLGRSIWAHIFIRYSSN